MHGGGRESKLMDDYDVTCVELMEREGGDGSSEPV